MADDFVEVTQKNTYYRRINTTKETIVSIMKACSYQTCSQSSDNCHSSNKSLFKQGNTERKNNI